MRNRLRSNISLASTLIRDHVIEITLPDGQNWFQGVREYAGTGKEPVRMNVWNVLFNELSEGHGVFSKDECKRYLPFIAMDGVSIRYYPGVRFEQEQKQKLLNDGNENNTDAVVV